MKSQRKVETFGDEKNKSEFNSREIKSRLSSGNSLYHSLPYFSSRLLSENRKIEIYKASFLRLLPVREPKRERSDGWLEKTARGGIYNF
jgi:hypothetical protein